jgi:hypothetical protein
LLIVANIIDQIFYAFVSMLLNFFLIINNVLAKKIESLSLQIHSV